MKKNLKNNIAQKGGLMIEALAMLGLIAVVTPTMYKKSAERALEVEDINTADTVRSYMGATEAYMAANYRNLIKEMTENDDGTPKENPDEIKEVSWSDIQSYMPYGFNNDKALYDYNSPKIAIWRDGTNLTAYALFPAKSDGGLGQERTSRIASLIGANGGYTKSDKSAHGIGGVWNLSADDVKEAFGSDDNNEFSLVTASSNVINSTSGAGAVENTKYLQRTAENDGEKWRNAMRTDLYMGGGDADADPDDSENTGNHNIVNINSLIVGADKDIDGANNGLYIAASWTDKDGNEHENTNINAYIGGTLTALGEKFLVTKDDNNKGFVYFGNTSASKPDGNDNPQYPFRIAESGKVTTVGDINLANANQATADNVVANIGSYGTTTDDIKINGKIASELTNPHLFHGVVDKDNDDHPYASVSLLSEEMFNLTSDNKEIDNGMDKVSGTHVMIEQNGFRGADNVSGEDSLGNEISPNYGNPQIFPVVIGSNAMVKGVMAAGQVDAQVLRTAALTTGSEHIDDEYKWLNVDRNGIVIREIDPEKTTTDENGKISTTGMYSEYTSNRYMTRTGKESNDARILLQRNELTQKDKEGNDVTTHYGNVEIKGKDTLIMTTDPTEGKVTLRNGRMGMQIQNRDLTIGVKDGDDITGGNSDMAENPYRVVIGKGGDVDMVGANLKIMDASNQNILTVKGNDNLETADKFGGGNVYNDFNTYSAADKPNYNVVTHGNILFSSMNEKNATEIASYDDAHNAKFMAIGPYDEEAGVNIVEGNDESALAKNRNANQVLFVDLSVKDTNAHVDASEAGEYALVSDDTSVSSTSTAVENHKMAAGTVYVRKGMVEVVPDLGAKNTDTNTGRANNPDFGANDGSGIIRASRLVANNINKKGEEEKVIDVLNTSVLENYNDGDNTVRYDTYMVNPAYTSVMKDIKLTTRGGARLSDILPDFITKGIYLASNTYDDDKQELYFKLKNDGSFKLVDEPDETPPVAVEDGSKYTKNNWASPYSGLVPAPQCPPGYGRVVTVNPFRFEMAQAGQLMLSADAGTPNKAAGDAGFYVNTTDMATKFKMGRYSEVNKEQWENELLKKVPTLRQMEIEWNNGSIEGAKLSSNFNVDGTPVTGEGRIDVTEANGINAYTSINTYKTQMESDENGDDSGSTTTPIKTSYVLSATEDGLNPLVFQQSTWLYTAAVPVVPNTDGNDNNTGDSRTYFGYKPNGKYVRGWAVLQGFLYHYNEYKDFACDRGACKELSPITTDDSYEVVWNLFPVAKYSLGSYVTTYCYFDRLNAQDKNFQEGEGSSTHMLIEPFDVLNEVPTSYKKGQVTQNGNSEMELKRKAYYENLNDPTMKYNEVW